jgi:hypothetical protein
MAIPTAYVKMKIEPSLLLFPHLLREVRECAFAAVKKRFEKMFEGSMSEEETSESDTMIIQQNVQKRQIFKKKQSVKETPARHEEEDTSEEEE